MKSKFFVGLCSGELSLVFVNWEIAQNCVVEMPSYIIIYDWGELAGAGFTTILIQTGLLMVIGKVKLEIVVGAIGFVGNVRKEIMWSTIQNYMTFSCIYILHCLQLQNIYSLTQSPTQNNIFPHRPNKGFTSTLRFAPQLLCALRAPRRTICAHRACSCIFKCNIHTKKTQTHIRFMTYANISDMNTQYNAPRVWMHTIPQCIVRRVVVYSIYIYLNMHAAWRSCVRSPRECARQLQGGNGTCMRALAVFLLRAID